MSEQVDIDRLSERAQQSIVFGISGITVPTDDVVALLAELQDLRRLRDRVEAAKDAYAICLPSGFVVSVRHQKSIAVAEAIAEYNDSSRVKKVRLVPVEEPEHG